MSFGDILTKYRDGVSQTNGYINMAYESDSHGNDVFDDEKKDFIISSAFLKMFIFWEEFLESSFLTYLTGEPSTSGTTVDCCVTPRDLDHASEILIGTQNYVDWASCDVVRRLAKIYLSDGDPISSNLLSISRELADLKTVRNAAAHMSSTTGHKFNALATRVLGVHTTNGKVSQFAPPKIENELIVVSTTSVKRNSDRNETNDERISRHYYFNILDLLLDDHESFLV